ncbi:MAG: FAD/NAD(P)-binding protein [Gaiellaceae bacterium]
MKSCLLEPEPYRVLANRQETADTSTLVLEQIEGEGMTLAPGQFAMVYAYGVGEAPISVSGDSDAGGTVHTVRDVGAVTHAIARAQPDSVLGLRGPFGVGWPLGEAIDRDVVIVAGGLGMAPLRPVVERVIADRSWYRQVSLLYGARTPADLLYRDELQEWDRDGQIAVELTVDSAEQEWAGRVGVVPKLLSRAQFDPGGCVAFVCGPEVMMRFTAAALLDAGVAGERIYVSLERHMECGVGLCGHCQLGPTLICRDGPVYRYTDVAPWLFLKEL